MVKCLGFLCAVLISIVPTVAAGGDLQAVLDGFLAENPGASGVVVRVICPPAGLDWSGAAGTEDHGVDTPLTPAHTFRIASNTKTYVAAAMLRLAEQGRLSMDDPLDGHLTPRVRKLLADDGYDLKAITLRQVLSHTAGLFEHPADPRYEEAILADPSRVWTRDEQIDLCVEWGDPIGPPGGQYKYSDTGYVILGGIVERQTGLSLGAAVHELLDYEALGLNATWWELDEPRPAAAGPRAHQYYGELDTIDWHPSLDLYGGGGLLCDADDLTLFMRRLLKGQVLQDEVSLAAMTGGGTASYRLGLICGELDGRLAIGHTGFWNTFVFHVPSLDLTLGGSVLDHKVEHCGVLAQRLVVAVAAGMGTTAPAGP